VRSAAKSTAKSALILRAPAFAYRRTAVGGPFTLFCEQNDLARLAARYGTPLYVYSAEAIRTRLLAFNKAFHSIPHTLCYSVKANSTLGILRLIAQQGAGFDVVSGGELERVLRIRAGAAAGVVFSGVGKTVAEMELALKSGILLFNVESASELHALAATAARLKKKAQIALRVNPDVSAKTHPYISTGLHEHKFGVPIPEARRLYAEAAQHQNLTVAGVSVHIGSQITDLTSFTDALERVAELVRELRRAGHKIKYVDAGGGLGIPYHDPLEIPNPRHPERSRPTREAVRFVDRGPHRARFSCDGVEEKKDPYSLSQPFAQQVSTYAQAVLAPLRKLDVHLLLEPGRSIVGPAGVLLTRVIYRKTNDGKRFLIVDAAMNDLLRPSLYGAHHEIVPVQLSPLEERDVSGSRFVSGHRFSDAGIHASSDLKGRGFSRAAKGAIKAALAAEVARTTSGNPPSAASELADVVGPICETGDFFARDRELPVMQEGDLLAILDAGAYGSVLASNYNTRGRPAEVLVDGAQARLIRSRETTSDQMRLER